MQQIPCVFGQDRCSFVFHSHFSVFASPPLRPRARHSPFLTSSRKRTESQQRAPWKNWRRSTWKMRSRSRNLTPGEEGSRSGLDFETALCTGTLCVCMCAAVFHWDLYVLIYYVIWCHIYFCKKKRKKETTHKYEVKKNEHVCGRPETCVWFVCVRERAFVRLQSSNWSQNRITGGGEWPCSIFHENSPPYRVCITSDDLLFFFLLTPPLPSLFTSLL